MISKLNKCIYITGKQFLSHCAQLSDVHRHNHRHGIRPESLLVWQLGELELAWFWFRLSTNVKGCLRRGVVRVGEGGALRNL